VGGDGFDIYTIYSIYYYIYTIVVTCKYVISDRCCCCCYGGIRGVGSGHRRPRGRERLRRSLVTIK
jgi:hypothetical protein